MTLSRPTWTVTRTVWPVAIGAGLVALACEVPRPTSPSAAGPAASSVTAAASRAAASRPAAGLTPGRAAVAAALRVTLASAAPELLSQRTGAVQRVWLLDSAGRTVRVVRPDAQDDAAAAFATRPVTNVFVDPFAPGQIGPDSLIVSRIRLAGADDAATLAAGPALARADSASRAGHTAAGVATIPAVRARSTAEAYAAGYAAGTAEAARAGGRAPLRRLPGQDAPPLYVVDGKVVPTQAGRAEPAGLPNDENIESISVLKGPSALRAYGARGRNGVVEITTKAAAPAAPAPQSGGTAGAPLYLIDGREVTRAAVDSLDTSLIASVEIEKSAEASGRYGVRAKGGVVRITTKAARPR